MASKARDGEDTAAEERDVTQRVVLKRERVLVLGDGVTLEDVVACADERALRKLLVTRPEDPRRVEIEAWVVIGEFAGHTKDAAIEACAGKPGTPDAKVGVYRAPGVRAWRGGVVYDAPPLPLVERRALED